MSNHAVGLRKVRTFAGVSTERRKQEGKYGVERAARGTVFGIVPYFVHVSVYTSVKKICPDDRQSRDCQILHGFSVPVKMLHAAISLLPEMRAVGANSSVGLHGVGMRYQIVSSKWFVVLGL